LEGLGEEHLIGQKLERNTATKEIKNKKERRIKQADKQQINNEPPET
jgi:hypothetical protein